MNNKEIARIFSEIADILEIQGANVFKVRAYQKAARIVENLSEPLEPLYREGKLEEIEGIGKGIAEKIAEAFDTGFVTEHQELLASIPEGLLSLLEVPGMGPKKAKLVYDELGITSIAALKEAAEAGKLQSLPGMGKKSEEKILKGIQNKEQATGRFILGIAQPVADDIIARIKTIKGVKHAEYAGSLRRGKETVGDVDILVSTSNSEPVIEEFFRTPHIADTIARGATKSSIRLENGLQVDLRVVSDKSFGAALQYFTGSKEHNVKLREMAVKKKLKINEYGVYEADTEKLVAGKTEESVYKAIGLVWIPPELREGFDEIELAKQNQLPPLIERNDLKAAFHNHTTASDGRLTLKELADYAESLGFEYIGLTDHSGSLGIANGLNADRLKQQIELVRGFNEKKEGIPVLVGAEVDIRVDGKLDYDDNLLAELDIVIAAVHASFEQPRDKITQRICVALENPHVDILAHPSGRLLGRRPAMDIDWDQVFLTAARHSKALELNAHYLRLDLNDQLLKQAKEYGLRFTIDSDNHDKDDFDNLTFGIKMARRGRLSKSDVLNTLSLAEWKQWKKKRK